MSDAARTERAGPAWEVARLFPDQGQWGESDYLELTEHTRRLVELSDGCIEVLTMPKTSHQKIVAYLYGLLLSFTEPTKLATVLFAPLRVRLWEGKFREPDIVLMLRAHAARIREEYWEGADLVVEVLSEDDPDRDLVTKRAEYARAKIPEYWIVDPRHERVHLLVLKDGVYESTEHHRGDRMASRLLTGLVVEVAATLDSARI